jgi:hypothetical protein
VFSFSTGTVNGSNTTKQQLFEINLAGNAAAAGVSITTTATRSATDGGDGFAALGQINAAGIDLGFVNIDGDLGRIASGDANFRTSGLMALSVASIGRYGLLTGASDLHSVIQGTLGALHVKSDIRDAEIDAVNSVFSRIGVVTIGGSLVGGAAPGSGRLFSEGDLGSVQIGGDVIGGAGANSGTLITNGSIAGVTIGGSLRGGAGQLSAVIISSPQTVGPVRIGGDIIHVDGSENSGSIFGVRLAGVTVGGSVIGGRIISSGAIGPVRIGGDLVGGDDSVSGEISSDEDLAGVSIGGSLRGGSGGFSGHIISHEDLGPVRIGGDVVGGTGTSDDGAITSNGNMAGVTVGGSLRGGVSSQSGRIASDGKMGPVFIRGGIEGGPGGGSGQITSAGALAGVTVAGAVRGGAGNVSGSILSNGTLGTVRIFGDLAGGTGTDSGMLFANNTLAGVAIGGSLRGGSGNNAGSIFSNAALGAVNINADLVGGSASGTASVNRAGYIQAYRIASLTLGGSLIAGIDNTSGSFSNNGAVRADDDIGAVFIHGSIAGNFTNPAIITARGSATPTLFGDVAIGRITVLGNIDHALIRAGVDVIDDPKNADAQIGPVFVGHDWSASTLAAGASAGVGGRFGDGNDLKMAGPEVKDDTHLISRIAGLTVAGQMLGTIGGTDSFGIVAQTVGAMAIGGVALALHTGNGNDLLGVGITNDLAVEEV